MQGFLGSLVKTDVCNIVFCSDDDISKCLLYIIRYEVVRIGNGGREVLHYVTSRRAFVSCVTTHERFFYWTLMVQNL